MVLVNILSLLPFTSSACYDSAWLGVSRLHATAQAKVSPGELHASVCGRPRPRPRLPRCATTMLLFWSRGHLVSRALQRLSLVSYICAFGNVATRRCTHVAGQMDRWTEVQKDKTTGRPPWTERKGERESKTASRRVKHVAGRVGDTRVSPVFPFVTLPPPLDSSSLPFRLL